MAVQREVEKMHPQAFEYILIKDGGVTGNMEVTLSKKGVDQVQGEMAHSKRGGQGYPHNDWESFHTRLDKAMKDV